MKNQRLHSKRRSSSLASVQKSRILPKCIFLFHSSDRKIPAAWNFIDSRELPLNDYPFILHCKTRQAQIPQAFDGEVFNNWKSLRGNDPFHNVKKPISCDKFQNSGKKHHAWKAFPRSKILPLSPGSQPPNRLILVKVDLQEIFVSWDKLA